MDLVKVSGEMLLAQEWHFRWIHAAALIHRIVVYWSLRKLSQVVQRL
jgi:hypothetical protein